MNLVYCPYTRAEQLQREFHRPLHLLAIDQAMNEDALNIQIRRFLKKTGITSQRSIEQAVREGLDNGVIGIGDSVEATMSLKIRKLGLDVDIVEQIKIED